MTLPPRHRHLPFVPCALVALLCLPAPAQDQPVELDDLFAWTAPDRPGCSVAVAVRGKEAFCRAYGAADLERSVPVTTATVFDAGSVVKQFVAAAVLLLVEDGRLALTDDVRAHVPELPDCGHRITIDHLLTHTSGIRDWTALARLSATSRDALAMILRQRALNFAPGEQWSYSNSGYVLLREIVARRAGVPLGEFLRARVFEPLGMKSSVHVADERELVANRALAYEQSGDSWRMAMRFGNERGGQGALFTTPHDLLAWNAALEAGRVGESVAAKLHEPTRLANGRTVGYGRGLFLDSYRGAKLVWHSGGAAGYKTWLGRFPEHGVSIAIMCNSDEGAERTPLARRIFERLVADLPPAVSDAPPVPDAGSAPDLGGRTGAFVCERTGDVLRLAADRGRLRLADGPGMVPSGEDRFRRWDTSLQFRSGDPFELHFVTEDELDFRSADGSTTRYRRARPVSWSAAELEPFAGTYRSDELDATLHVVPRDGKLDVRLAHHAQGVAFGSVDGDTFAFGPVLLRFARDEAGRVTGARYSNPVLRDVRFARSADGG